MLQAEKLHDESSELERKSDCKFVERSEFVELLLSFKRVIRADDLGINVLGLLDLDTGTRFLIEQEKLFPNS